MKTQLFFRNAAVLLAALLLSACGSEGAGAASMHLRSLIGMVSVLDDAGKNLNPQKDMRLYSGYAVDTKPESFAWIDLDEVKLVKLDEESEIVIQKEDGLLEIEVKSGSMYFEVNQPLEADETMTIRSSTMMIGIRGTCGWVEVPEPGYMNVYLLEGTVECTAGQTATVKAGEMARLNEAAGTVIVEPFGQNSIPSFVQAELDNKGISLDDIPETVEIMPETAPIPDDDDPLAAGMAAYREVVAKADTYDYTYDMPYREPGTPTGDYYYALVQVQSHHDVPALLIKQDRDSGFNIVKIFQYFPRTGEMFEPGILPEGVDSDFHISLYVPTDKRSIIYKEYYSNSGWGSTRRYTFGGSGNGGLGLEHGLLYDGKIEEDPSEAETGRVEIEWYDITDMTGLDNGKPSGA